MKTAPFDLELAKLGHPLITRGGDKVVEFNCFNTDCPGWLCSRAIINRPELLMLSYNKQGMVNTSRTSPHDLFLDLETPWEKPLQPGGFIAYEDDGAAMATFVGYHNGKVVASPVGSDIYKVLTVWQRIDPVYTTKSPSKLSE